MAARLLRTILVLPGTVLVFVPALILWLARGTVFGAAPAVGAAPFWLGVGLLAGGFGLALWTCRLFVTIGQGTPAPWDPPQALVVRGPYRHVRNPMITSVLIMLAGEALVLLSWGIALWLVVFFAANAVYFPLSEEPGLVRRFGAPYRRYQANVPRWLPRWRPWDPPA